MRLCTLAQASAQVGEINTNGCFAHLTEAECRQFAETDSTVVFDKVKSWDNRPKGCFWHVENKKINFNTDAAGGISEKAKPVCKLLGKYFHPKVFKHYLLACVMHYDSLSSFVSLFS